MLFDYAYLTGWNLIWSQFKAMLLKNMLYTWKNIFILVVQILTPIFYVGASSLSFKFVGQETQLNPLTIDLKPYKNNPVILLSDQVRDNTSLSKNFVDNYEGLFTDSSLQNGILQKTESIRDYILGLTMREFDDFNKRYLAGVTVDNENITAWFNNQPYHTIPLTINLVFNGLIQVFCANCSIQVTNAPLPFKMENRLLLIKSVEQLGSKILMKFVTAMCIVPAFYIIFYIRERASYFKLLQLISGTSIWIYWISAFIFDFFTFVITIIICLVMLFAFQIEGWSTLTELASIFLLLIFFIWSILPMVYLYSKTTDTPSKGFTYFTTVSYILGMLSFFTSCVLDIIEVEFDLIGQVFYWILLIMPQFAMINGLLGLFAKNSITKVNI